MAPEGRMQRAVTSFFVYCRPRLMTACRRVVVMLVDVT